MMSHPTIPKEASIDTPPRLRPGRRLALLACGALLIVTGCGLKVEEGPTGYPQKVGSKGETRIHAPTASEAEDQLGKITGEGGFFGSSKKSSGGDGGAGIGVNSFLWRATLNTISFMPVNSADPFGGVIITDWHAPPETPNERFKLNIYIIGRTLRADGIKVSVFRQTRTSATGTWQDAATPRQTATSIEDAILMQARQIRNSVALQ